jgi:hypothetical protein
MVALFFVVVAEAETSLNPDPKSEIQKVSTLEYAPKSDVLR